MALFVAVLTFQSAGDNSMGNHRNRVLTSPDPVDRLHIELQRHECSLHINRTACQHLEHFHDFRATTYICDFHGFTPTNPGLYIATFQEAYIGHFLLSM